MKVLAIDTATSCGAVGLNEDGRPVAELSVLSQETHSARLLPGIEWILKTAGWSIGEIDGFGLTLGPGSFTGLRVGLSTIKGFAFALRKPVVGLGSLEVLASQYQDGNATIVPMLDARRERVYGAAYHWDHGALVASISPCDIAATDLIRKIEGAVVCLGEGARKYASAVESLGRHNVSFAPIEFDLPRGSTIAQMTYRALVEGRTLDIHHAEPAYMRASEAELRKKEAVI